MLLIILRVVNRTGWNREIVSRSHSQAIEFRETGLTTTTVLSTRNIAASRPEQANGTSVTEGGKTARTIKI